MKTYWDIDINNKIASFKDDEIIYKFKFEADFDEFLVFYQAELLENNHKIDISKMHTYMRIFGDELSLSFNHKLQFKGEADRYGVKMYCLEDNIYIDEDGAITILDKMGFEDTCYMCDLETSDMESIPVNIAKLFIYCDNEEDEDSGYVTFSEFKENIF